MADDDKKKFSITFALDRDNFFRRTCPSCGRDFKTEADPGDMTSMLQPFFRQLESELGEEEFLFLEGENKPQTFFCPYCQHEAESGDMLTAYFGEYLKRLIMREYVLPKVNGMLSDFTDGLKSGTRSNSFIRLEVSSSGFALPLRPISGPEAPDMTIVEMLCCGKRVKIYDDWYDLEKCPYCGENVRIV
jgi:uncharacterized Zn-finger protein